MITLKARLDFLEGNYEEGLIKICNAIVLTTDVILSSHTLLADYLAVISIKLLYRELMPLFISGEVDYEQDIVGQLTKLTSISIETLKPESSYYKEYLYSRNMVLKLKKYRVKYFLFEKLALWKSGFSINRFMNKWNKFYNELFEGIKYIRNRRDKSIYIRDFIMKNAPRGPGTSLGFLPLFAFRLNLVRMFEKLTLILITIQRHGLNSSEFLALKGTDVFINEFSGKKFEIAEEDSENFIILDEDFKLSLKRIDYREDHKKILQSFKYFDVRTEEELRSIFYSFELE